MDMNQIRKAQRYTTDKAIPHDAQQIIIKLLAERLMLVSTLATMRNIAIENINTAAGWKV